ncbi:hypothetical protein KC19_6G037300 [Ceratodon purpureus]|uniref:Uncharacterized protein n=1 Tax=Ceratodon purpureus TaxID=3225 RepID=A0A8T0HEL1_CERPU|nr:hypothetical protein KC19_6G037300 [Ceratodon purpureus]
MWNLPHKPHQGESSIICKRGATSVCSIPNPANAKITLNLQMSLSPLISIIYPTNLTQLTYHLLHQYNTGITIKNHKPKCNSFSKSTRPALDTQAPEIPRKN